MKKVLIHQNSKADVYVWDVSTEILLKKAYSSLFKVLKNEGLYTNLEDTPRHEQWYLEALGGNYSSMVKLLTSRKDYGGESWYITEVEK